MRAPFRSIRAGSTCGCAPASTAGGNWFESNAALHPGPGTPGVNHLLSFCQTAGKDLLRRRVNTVAMRKSVTHDSRDRPAIWRNWVGPGSNLGPEDGSIPSCASNGCRSRGVYLDSRQRPARRTSDCPAVICSIGVVVTPLPSKQVSPVRIRYAAPAGRIRPFLSLFSLPIPQLTAGKDRASGLAMFPEVIWRSSVRCEAVQPR